MPVDRCYYVGLDLGQSHDWTALAVLARPAVDAHTPADRRRPAYTVPYLRRSPPGTPYRDIRSSVAAVLDRLADGFVVLLIDETGVGEAVVQWFAAAAAHRDRCRAVPVILTAGPWPDVCQDRAVLPRKSLVGALQLVLQARRLQVARSLPEAAVLGRELESFRARVGTTDPAAATAWREGPRDDLVLAVALAAWAGETALGGIPEEDGPVPPEWWDC